MIEILGISIEILGFSFEILGISELCDNRIPYIYLQFRYTEQTKKTILLYYYFLPHLIRVAYVRIIKRKWQVPQPVFLRRVNCFASNFNT